MSSPQTRDAAEPHAGPQPGVTLPPAPPGESPPDEVRKTRAVAEALEQLGRETEPEVLVEHLKGRGLAIEPGEVVAIRAELIRRAASPPGPDQPPPPEARRKPDADPRASRPPPAPGTGKAVGEVMTRDVEAAAPHHTLQEAAAKMKALNVGALPVCEGDVVVGMITDRDITVRAVAHGHDAFEARVRDVMTPDLVFCYQDQDVREAAGLMQEKRVRRLAVLDRDRRLVGIVSLGDVAADPAGAQLAGETLKRVTEAANPSS